MIDTVLTYLTYLLVALFFASVFFFILTGPIIDWLDAREKRKKAAAAADGVKSAESASSVAKSA